MAITKQQKEEITQQLMDRLSAAKAVVISASSQITVNEDQSLRSELRQANVDYMIVKKTLLKKALTDAELDLIDLEAVQGNVGVATSEDEISAAKVLYTYSKDNENVSIVAGYLESVLIDSGKIASLASLPSKEELIAKTLATINAPVQNFVGLLSAVPRSLLYALNAIKEQKN